MAVTRKVLVDGTSPSSTSSTTIYTSTVNTETQITAFTVTNYQTTPETYSVWIGSATDANLLVKTRTLKPGESDTPPEVEGHILNSAQTIIVQTSLANSMSFYASGNEFTQ